jgi:hypothetical protein
MDTDVNNLDFQAVFAADDGVKLDNSSDIQSKQPGNAFFGALGLQTSNGNV